MEKLEPSEVKTLVKDLVEKNHAENDINYNTYFANHAVHGVCTLFSLGGDILHLSIDFLNSNST